MPNFVQAFALIIVINVNKTFLFKLNNEEKIECEERNRKGDLTF